MSDALALPSLTASALTQLLDFLLRRADVMLNRRADSNRADPAEDSHVPEVVTQIPGSFDFDPTALTQETTHHISSLVQLLGLYSEHPELIRGDDGRLLRSLAALRSALEGVYGRPIALQGENRRGGVRVRQDEDEVYGQVRGIKARRVGDGADGEIIQTSKIVHRGAEVIGAEFDEFG